MRIAHRISEARRSASAVPEAGNIAVSGERRPVGLALLFSSRVLKTMKTRATARRHVAGCVHDRVRRGIGVGSYRVGLGVTVSDRLREELVDEGAVPRCQAREHSHPPPCKAFRNQIPRYPVRAVSMTGFDVMFGVRA
jgi:hypothetical protein